MQTEMCETPTAQRDAALGRLEQRHAAWMRIAHRAVLDLHGEFTTDDVWPLVPPVVEPRAMGAVLQQLRRDGVITPTGRYIPSGRSENHGRPVLVWARVR